MTVTRSTVDLDELVSTFRKGLYLPDPGVFYVTAAAVVANLLPGYATWLLLVGPPSSAKSTLLQVLRKLPGHFMVDSITEAGLLSGTVPRDGSGTGGVLRLVGDHGTLIASDFSTLLGTHSETRATIFAALRKIADGVYTRRVGTAGGMTLEWEGRCGFLGAVTQAIDSPDVTMGQLGERFAYFRLPPATVDDDLMACSLAAETTGRELTLAAEWADAVAAFVGGLTIPDELPSLTERDYDRMATLATLGARLRSPVVRDGRTRELVVVPTPERPMRLLRQLRHLHAGFVVIGCPEAETWRLLGQVALGGTHPGRRAVVEFLIGEAHGHTTTNVAASCRVPKTSAQRHLEDLTAHGVVDLTGEMPQIWTASDWLREAWWAVDGSEPAPHVQPSAPPIDPQGQGPTTVADDTPDWAREEF